jgi:hypothetical protein
MPQITKGVFEKPLKGFWVTTAIVCKKDYLALNQMKGRV